MRFVSEDIVWQEVPNEVSLAFLISGCPLGCKGCHSAYSWDSRVGHLLSEPYFEERLTLYQNLISCVLFMGGEWHPEELCSLLTIAQQRGLNTCLYTGLEKEQIPDYILSKLTYIKTGRWIAERGGLNSLTTNQRFIHLKTGEVLNHLFCRSK
ncbi:anaerobic ribonucleoside-triphosphate reductase activating protein [Otariodibacter oris]|uniref:Anaerobic ribonucleoside-triphosphate reductase activating protein n=1 Tax=Otariodibacter oris TaxID=1032623 RepID=A0A420XG76_9PAST|nr:anaerobic ribonucleoside-triphosphate reductase activating protein [Otariodibacter oris]QGM79945.1 anaerobic ribonucleoside-triphosphate reductase activating protein [Otariodibacter oris]RKR71766.1 anaerobic ribonucleoside-triphosphate reductase activating protein [Otariodibacter oris]